MAENRFNFWDESEIFSIYSFCCLRLDLRFKTFVIDYKNYFFLPMSMDKKFLLLVCPAGPRLPESEGSGHIPTFWGLNGTFHSILKTKDPNLGKKMLLPNFQNANVGPVF